MFIILLVVLAGLLCYLHVKHITDLKTLESDVFAEVSALKNRLRNLEHK